MVGVTESFLNLSVLWSCDQPYGRTNVYRQLSKRAEKAAAEKLVERGLLEREPGKKTMYRTTDAGRFAALGPLPEGKYRRRKDGMTCWARPCGGRMHVYPSGMPTYDEDERGWHVSRGGFVDLYEPRA